MRIQPRPVSLRSGTVFDIEAFSHYPADGIRISGSSRRKRITIKARSSVGQNLPVLSHDGLSPAHIPCCVPGTDFQNSLWSRRFLSFPRTRTTCSISNIFTIFTMYFLILEDMIQRLRLLVRSQLRCRSRR